MQMETEILPMFSTEEGGSYDFLFLHKSVTKIKFSDTINILIVTRNQV